MHEYILYSQIPASREKQVLNILAGVAGAQPVPICEQNLIFAQTKVPEIVASKKNAKSQQPKQLPVPSHHKLVRDIHLEGDATVDADDWRFRAEQVPEPGIHAFISRDVIDQPATDEQKTRFKDASWYQYKQQYTVVGNRFVLDNVIVRIVRFHIPSSAIPTDPVSATPTTLDSLKLLDASGSMVIECIIRVEDASNSAIADKAKEELLRFQSRMDGAIDLYAPDRLSLDTRVRGS